MDTNILSAAWAVDRALSASTECVSVARIYGCYQAANINIHYGRVAHLAEMWDDFKFHVIMPCS